MKSNTTSSLSSSDQRVLDLGNLGREAEAELTRENYIALRSMIEREQLQSRSATERALLLSIEDEALSGIARRAEILKNLTTGTVVVPLVHAGHGCLRWLSFGNRGASETVQPQLAEDSRRAINSGCLAIVKLVADELRVPPPMPQSRFTFRIWGCEDGDHLPIGDYSITLPAAVAFFSAWTGRPVPAGWVLTGNIDPQTGQLIPVGSLREKLAALSTELQGWFKMLIVPASAETADYPRNAEHLLPVRTLPEALDLLWGATWQKVNPEKLDLAGALEDATAEYYTGNNQAALLAFDRIAILCGQKGQMRRIKYHALWRRGSCDTHLGNINIAKLSIEKAHKLGRQLLSEKIILPDDYYGCLTSNAICLDDAYDFANAAAAINEVIRHLLKARATPEALGRAMGTRALISLHLRRLADAECSCLRSITAFKTFGKMAELSRSYCWLAIVRGERGDLEGADRAFNKAKEYAGILSPAAFQSQYFAYADARISVRTHRYRRCVRRTADLTSKATTSWPIALAIRYRAEAHLRLNKLEECLDDCHRSQDLFSHLEIGETIAPLAAQPHIVATVANMQMADYSSASEQWASAIQLINRHKGASNYFQPTLRRIASEMVARHACEHLNLLKRMPY